MEIKCHFCFETIPLEIYVEEGEKQDFIVDCEVCCHPLHIIAEWNDEEEVFNIEVDAG
ncbi:MAG: CPXCG motif-containing cysteine-rich protein [Bacteriovoracaceae bacterium]|nr:CPXCG motif-containing cysteine-rich protein [Bacteriovoracaceae bacterium]